MKSSGKSCQWSHQAKDANEVIRQKLPVKSSGKSCQWSHQAKDANEVIRQKMPVKSSGISCQWSHWAKDASCGGRGGGGMPLCACQSVKFRSCSSGCPLKKKTVLPTCWQWCYTAVHFIVSSADQENVLGSSKVHNFEMSGFRSCVF